MFDDTLMKPVRAHRGLGGLITSGVILTVEGEKKPIYSLSLAILEETTLNLEVSQVGDPTSSPTKMVVMIFSGYSIDCTARCGINHGIFGASAHRAFKVSMSSGSALLSEEHLGNCKTYDLGMPFKPTRNRVQIWRFPKIGVPRYPQMDCL